MYRVLFGAGEFGKMAVNEYGYENISAIIDNDIDKQGSNIYGIPVIDLLTYKNKYNKYPIVISSAAYTEIAAQLRSNGISNYSYYNVMRQYFSQEDLIINYYTNNNIALDDEQYNSNVMNFTGRDEIEKMVPILYDKQPNFCHVEIETINRCNGICSFCPVNAKIDPRTKSIMTDDLFKKIIGELKDINYDGRIALFSNNEPLLDEKIIERNAYVKKNLPNAFLHLWTNGTLLTLEKYKSLMNYLDEIIIDNYNQELKLIPTVQKIAQYCNDDIDCRRRTKILLRKQQEILTSRGGFAPNRSKIADCGDAKCALPFKQLIIRPTGEVSLCCNDPTGAYTMGDVSKDALLDVWRGEMFKKARKALSMGRKYWGRCKDCDTFNPG